MATSRSQKKKWFPPVFLVMAGALLILLALALADRNASVRADAAQVTVSPQVTVNPAPTRSPGETRAHTINSPADCAQNRYRQVDLPAGEESREIAFAEPPNPDGPVLVDLGLYIIQITAINIVDNTFHIEGFLHAKHLCEYPVSPRKTGNGCAVG